MTLRQGKVGLIIRYLDDVSVHGKPFLDAILGVVSGNYIVLQAQLTGKCHLMCYLVKCPSYLKEKWIISILMGRHVPNVFKMFTSGSVGGKICLWSVV